MQAKKIILEGMLNLNNFKLKNKKNLFINNFRKIIN
jgi:hypothetical protein